MSLASVKVSGTIPTEELDRHPWLQIQAALLKPCSPPELLATVKNVLLATDGARGDVAPPSWQNQPSVDRLQL
jgi:hypothetical protein